MKRLALTAVAGMAAAAVALGTASPALATNHEVTMTGPASGSPGQSLVIRLSGVVAPPAEWWDMSWIEVVALPGDLMPTCPGDAGSAGAIAEQAGLILAIAMRPTTDVGGNFTNSVGLTPTGSGQVLICSYLYDDVGYTWSGSEMRIQIGGSASSGSSSGSGSAGGGGAPANVSPPWVSRAGRRLVCHPGSWSNSPGSFSYRWLLDRRLTRVTGARPYAPPRARGHTVRCQVTASGAGGTATATSRPLRLR